MSRLIALAAFTVHPEVSEFSSRSTAPINRGTVNNAFNALLKASNCFGEVNGLTSLRVKNALAIPRHRAPVTFIGVPPLHRRTVFCLSTLQLISLGTYAFVSLFG